MLLCWIAQLSQNWIISSSAISVYILPTETGSKWLYDELIATLFAPCKPHFIPQKSACANAKNMHKQHSRWVFLLIQQMTLFRHVPNSCRLINSRLTNNNLYENSFRMPAPALRVIFFALLGWRQRQVVMQKKSARHLKMVLNTRKTNDYSLIRGQHTANKWQDELELLTTKYRRQMWIC